MKGFSLILAILFVSISALALPACSSKKKSSPSATSPLHGGLPTADVAADREADLSGHTTQAPQKFYYSDVQVVVQTEPDGACSDDKKLQETREDQPTVTLSDDGKLQLSFDPKGFRLFLLNVNFQLTGFDSARFSFTAVDGVAPKKLPVPIRFRRLPGNILELSYLGETVKMVLQTTPMHSFTAREERDGCKIIHHVNVFSDRTSYYPLAYD